MTKKRILLAEDDELFASLLSYWFEKEGYEVEIAINGLEVLEMLKDKVPDLVIADIMMPFYSGIEVTDHIRNNLGLQLPIVLISAASNDQNVLDAFEMGANDFLAKPISPPELLVRVSRTLNTMNTV